jgi:hypothetical protein
LICNKIIVPSNDLSAPYFDYLHHHGNLSNTEIKGKNKAKENKKGGRKKENKYGKMKGGKWERKLGTVVVAELIETRCLYYRHATR